MVFSDPIFLFAFLPATFLFFHATRLWFGGYPALLLLTLCSCIFYAYWSIPFLFLLLGQIGFNYLIARQLQRRPGAHLLIFAILANLTLLGYFKYRNFFLDIWGDVTGSHFVLARLIVPLAISFHTFQQIALLVDVKDGEVEVPPPLNYLFFVVFFPQLIAGPIVLHREMGAQVEATKAGRSPGFLYAGAGVFIFILGLFKKAFLADKIAPFIDVAFTPNLQLTFPEAWLGAVGYALQLYFDFSGYSDMAVGLGLLFGFRLPYNFLIPFRSTSMIEYWKRWHITMTRFFTMYTYMPVAIASTRLARQRRLGPVSSFALSTVAPTMTAFLASGLWHGAGWNYIMFGVSNGVGISVNHIWNSIKGVRLPKFLAWLLTAVTILVSLVYFRSQNLAQANIYLGEMFHPGAFAIPAWLASHLHGHGWPTMTYEWLAGGTITLSVLALIGVLAPLSVLLPAYSAEAEHLKPTIWKAIAAALMLWLTLSVLDQPRSFIYFAF